MKWILKPELFGLTLIVLEYVFYLFIDRLTVIMKYFGKTRDNSTKIV
jgi:hypothetical protein